MKGAAFLAGIFVFCAAAAAGVYVTANAYAAAQEKETLYRYLSDALDPVEDPAETVSWSAPERGLDREFTVADERLVGRALASAWRAHAAAMATGEIGLLDDYFSGIVLERARISALQGFSDGTQMVVLEQSAKPEFYHLDGSVLQISAQALTVRFARGDQELLQFEIGRDAVVTTLMNETTGWRLSSHERKRALPAPERGAAPFPSGHLSGVNYYPAKTPWRRFWPEFDPDVVHADLALISGLGANAVRIFLPVADFADPPRVQGSIAKLDRFLDLAEAAGLKVVPTLFDLKTGYRPGLWPKDAAYLRAVLPVLSRSPAVAVIDIKNEPDLDFATHGRSDIEAWLRTMIAITHEIAPDVPLTVGWSSAAAAGLVADELDAISYHDYEDPATTADRLREVRRTAGGKPVYVTEIGASSYTALAGFPGSPEAQARHLAVRLEALHDAEGVFVWTLHDFEAPDAKAVGASPWTRRLQSRFGLHDASGTQKPAAAEVAKAFERRSAAAQ